MNIKHILVASLILWEASVVSEGKEPPVLNVASSRLESIFDYANVIPQSVLNTDKTAIYPRIKKLRDGSFILFCQGGRIASRIYYYHSSDLINWESGGELFSPYPVETSLGNDTRCFSTADAIVLSNGDILAVCSFRANAGYKNNVGCGLMLRRSSDNGHTWSDEQVIYEGANWEPYLLQLPDGKIQCYFTDANPQYRNSGTSLISSNDNGKTWGGYSRVCRQFKYVDRGVRIYTDQMPSFRLMPDGETILGFLEARLEPDGPSGKSIFKMSLVRNHGLEWKSLSDSASGPSDRETDIANACAGYVSIFPSGEVLLSCNINGIFSLKLGDGYRFNGRNWDSDWFQPFSQKGYWGSTEVISPLEVVGAMHCDSGIQTGVFYLNHAIDASSMKVKMDGDWKEWPLSQALFIGSDSPVQTTFRAAHDGKKLYLLVQTTSFDAEINISLKGASDITFEVGHDGLKSSSKGIKYICKDGANSLGETGCSYEISIPFSCIRHEEKLMFNAIVKSSSNPNIVDGFTGADPAFPSTWLPINIIR
jgi:hypothetical protein